MANFWAIIFISLSCNEALSQPFTQSELCLGGNGGSQNSGSGSNSRMVGGGGFGGSGSGSTTTYGLPSGMSLWLNATNGAYKDDGITLATNGQAVYRWSDMSGNNNAIQDLAPSEKPPYITNGIGGLPTINFSNGVFLRITNSVFMQSQPQTFFVVTKNVVNFRGGIFYSANSSHIQLHDNNSLSTQMSLYAGTTLTWTYNTVGLSYYITCIANGASSSVRILGSQVASGDIGSGGFGATVDIGVDTNFYIGYISEIIVYPRVLTSTEITTVETYLKNKYGL